VGQGPPYERFQLRRPDLIRYEVRFHQRYDSMATTHPIDTNQIRARIVDLKERVASLRGYL